MTPEQMASTTRWTLDEWQRTAKILGDLFPRLAEQVALVAVNGSTPSQVATAMMAVVTP